MKYILVLFLAFFVASCNGSSGTGDINSPIKGAFGHAFGDALSVVRKGRCDYIRPIDPLPDYADKKWSYMACVSDVGQQIHTLKAIVSYKKAKRTKEHCIQVRDKFIEVIQKKYDGTSDKEKSGTASFYREFQHGDVKYSLECSNIAGFVIKYTNEKLKKEYREEIINFKREQRQIREESQRNKVNKEFKGVSDSAF